MGRWPCARRGARRRSKIIGPNGRRGTGRSCGYRSRGDRRRAARGPSGSSMPPSAGSCGPTASRSVRGSVGAAHSTRTCPPGTSAGAEGLTTPPAVMAGTRHPRLPGNAPHGPAVRRTVAAAAERTRTRSASAGVAGEEGGQDASSPAGCARGYATTRRLSPQRKIHSSGSCARSALTSRSCLTSGPPFSR